VRIVALDGTHWPWVAEHVQCLYSEDTKGLVALDAHDKIAGALVLDNWTFTTVNVHFALANPMAIRRGLFDETYRYVFETCGRRMMVGVTPADRVKALKLVKHLGWSEVYRFKDGFDEGIDLIYSLYTKEEWLMKRAA
jgi:hypothetical protein